LNFDDCDNKELIKKYCTENSVLSQNTANNLSNDNDIDRKDIILLEVIDETHNICSNSSLKTTVHKKNKSSSVPKAQTLHTISNNTKIKSNNSGKKLKTYKANDRPVFVCDFIGCNFETTISESLLRRHKLFHKK
jgi:hypothetical protein